MEDNMTVDQSLFDWEARYNLESLQGLLKSGVKITLVIRDPSNPRNTMFYGNDEALKHVLEHYFSTIEHSFGGGVGDSSASKRNVAA